MIGQFQLADLTIEIEGSIEELVDAQGVEREFDRACRKIRKAAGSDVQILVDKDLESDEGRTFSKIRLRAYSGGKNYTIDCGSTDENILGVYVPWDAPVEVYDRETDTVEEVHPFDEETGDSEEGEAEGMEIPETLNPDAPPTPTLKNSGTITEEAATVLWSAANQSGHSPDSFQKMLASVGGVTNPRVLHVDDWKRAWAFAVDPQLWKRELEIEEKQELPM